MIIVHVLISGQVTGVGFRYFIERNARLLGVGGWVRNMGENVEAEFEGYAESVAKMMELCKKGPSGGRVDEVKILETKKGSVGGEFRIVL